MPGYRRTLSSSWMIRSLRRCSTAGGCTGALSSNLREKKPLIRSGAFPPKWVKQPFFEAKKLRYSGVKPPIPEQAHPKSLKKRRHSPNYTLHVQLIAMSATTLIGCSRRCHLFDISLCELSHRSLHDGFGMELLPFMRKQDPEFIFGGFLEVGHRGYDGVEV